MIFKNKPTECFICGKKLDRSVWEEDYCKEHESNPPTTSCSSRKDWGLIMELHDMGIIERI